MNRLLIISTFLPFYIFSSCEITYDEKIPLFGDLHVHTALSLDAATQEQSIDPMMHIDMQWEREYRFNPTMKMVMH